MPKQKKYSKSAVLDKAQEQRDKDWLNNQPRSQHFAVNTGVIYAGRRYTINQYVYDYVILLPEDGPPVKLKNPYFMQYDNRESL